MAAKKRAPAPRAATRTTKLFGYSFSRPTTALLLALLAALLLLAIAFACAPALNPLSSTSTSNASPRAILARALCDRGFLPMLCRGAAAAHAQQAARAPGMLSRIGSTVAPRSSRSSSLRSLLAAAGSGSSALPQPAQAPAPLTASAALAAASARNGTAPASAARLLASMSAAPGDGGAAMTTTMAAVAVAEPAAAEAEEAPFSTPETNPLLKSLDTLLPLYDEVRAEHVVPGMRALLRELHATVDALEAQFGGNSPAKPSWGNLVGPLERLSDRHSRTWNVVGHLKGVQDSEALRKAVDEVQPENVKFGLRLSQSVPLYRAFRALKEDDPAAWEALSSTQKRVVELELRDFVLGGVALEGAEKEEYNAIQQELAKLSTKYSNNVLDATKAFKKLVRDPKQVEGLPPTALALAAQQARQSGEADATPESGPWLLTLDFPCYYPVMTHAKDRALREEMYRAYVTRASSGESDNGGNIERVLALRKRKAELLGFKSYADLSMASKMATLDEAEKLLEELRAASWDAAKRDLEEVKSFAAENGAASDELLWWDVAYWAERLRESRYDLQDEQLRPYFALPAVLDGLFALVNRLFGVDVVPADGEAPVWHPDVRFFRVVDAATREPRAAFFLDPYSRPAEKRGGAWMAEVVGRSALLSSPGSGGKPRLPVAHMVCNQSPPVDGAPSLMTFREVETLFHEFGHAAQHMLTQVDEGMVAGIRGIEWDAVELPSQWLEGFCYHKATLLSFARHWQTGEPLPDALYERLVAAKNFRSGTMMLRQVHFASVDLELHARYEPNAALAAAAGGGSAAAAAAGSETVFDRDRAVAARTQVMPPFPEDRFLCSFSHIFAGGYSAGYYSYKWAETMSADAFAAFEEAGLDNAAAVKETGARFRDTVLGLGGSVAPAEVFKRFRGRGPSTEALLKQSGLLVKA